MKSIILAISISILIIITSGDTEVNKEVVEQFRQAEINWFEKSNVKGSQNSKEDDFSTANQTLLGRIFATLLEQFTDILYNSMDIFHIWKIISYLLCCFPCLANIPHQNLKDLTSRICQKLRLADLFVIITNKWTARSRRIDV